MTNIKRAAIGYYEAMKEEFDLYNEEGTSPLPGQAIYNKNTKAFWSPETCREQGVSFTAFVKGYEFAHGQDAAADMAG